MYGEMTNATQENAVICLQLTPFKEMCIGTVMNIETYLCVFAVLLSPSADLTAAIPFLHKPLHFGKLLGTDVSLIL